MNSLSFCHFENTFYYRADFQEGDIENETKTMIELAEDARFIVDLKKVEASDLVLYFYFNINSAFLYFV